MEHSFDEHSGVLIQTDCGDAMWMDRTIACGSDPWWVNWPWYYNYDCGGHPERAWGRNNHDGWCLSTDRNDYRGWNNDGIAQHVGDNNCFTAIHFRQDGGVDGFNMQ